MAAESHPQDAPDPSPPRPHLDPQGISHDAIHNSLGEGVKGLVRTPHEFRLEQVSATPIVLKHTCVELHGHIWR